jgi:hypothetical protein
VSIGRLSNGEKISGGSAILLFVCMFIHWYGLKVGEQPNLLFGLRLLDDSGNAWQTLEVTPIVLALVIAVTVGAAVWRLIGQDWEPRVSPGAVVFVLGTLATCLILIQIVSPPDLGGEVEGFTFEVILKAGIFLSLAAACGIAYGGGRAMREEGASLAGLWPLRYRDKRQLHTRGGR